MRANLESLWAVAVLIVSMQLAAAWGHGGRYRPPKENRPPPPPPVYNGPGDLVGGAAAAGPSAPGAPGTGGAASAGRPAASGGAAAALAGGGAAIAPRTGGTLADAFDLSSWSWWWEFNKEPYLDLRGRLEDARVVSGSDAFDAGPVPGDGERHGRRPSAAELREVVLPALRAALAASESNDMTTACLVALARIAEDLPGVDRGELRAVLSPYLADAQQEVAETAAAALGILGDRGAAVLLSELALDTEAGRPRGGTRTPSACGRAPSPRTPSGSSARARAWRTCVATSCTSSYGRSSSTGRRRRTWVWLASRRSGARPWPGRTPSPIRTRA